MLILFLNEPLIHCFLTVPQLKKSSKEPNPVVQLSIQDVTRESRVRGIMYFIFFLHSAFSQKGMKQLTKQNVWFTGYYLLDLSSCNSLTGIHRINRWHESAQRVLASFPFIRASCSMIVPCCMYHWQEGFKAGVLPSSKDSSFWTAVSCCRGALTK